MNKLIEVINSFQKLDSTTEDAIRGFFVEEKFMKNEFLVEEHKICTKVYFIKSGAVRRFCFENDEEVTKWIYIDNQFITSMSSFFEQNLLLKFFRLVKKQLSIHYHILMNNFYWSILYFLKFHLKQLRYYLSRINEFHHLFRVMTAEKKYLFLLESFPQIIQKAKLKHIASLIGVSQETLSRIRASII